MNFIAKKIPLLFHHCDNEYIQKKVSCLSKKEKLEIIIFGALKSLSDNSIISGDGFVLADEGLAISKYLDGTFVYTKKEYDMAFDSIFTPCEKPESFKRKEKIVSLQIYSSWIILIAIIIAIVMVIKNI